MDTVEVIADPAASVAALDATRARLLAELRAPASAAELAERIGLSRQRISYHLSILESHGLVRVAETRQWGGLTERRLVATAVGYVVSPAALGDAASDPARTVLSRGSGDDRPEVATDPTSTDESRGRGRSTSRRRSR